MNSMTDPRRAGSSERRLFQSYHSFLRSRLSTGACGLDHVTNRWKKGNRWNMPAGCSSAEINACFTPSCVR